MTIELAVRPGARDTHKVRADGVEAAQDPSAMHPTEPSIRSLVDPALYLAADVLDDIERVRTANASRLRIMTASTEDSDGEIRGFGLDESHPDVARLAAMVDMLGKLEHDAELNLNRLMRRNPLYGWVKAQRGVGVKQAARLLAAIGDPYLNSATGKVRTMSALWAYCGYHVLPVGQERDATQVPLASGLGGDPGHGVVDTQRALAGVAPKRQRGQRVNWSPAAKTRAYLVATSCLKQLRKPCGRADGERIVHVDECRCSTYRLVYDGRREHTATTHPGWTDLHSFNDAMRVASKAVLRDLWRAARDYHLEVATDA